jgi:hypothetical protein
VCPCCGYEIDRNDIDLCSDIDRFNFLGSGVPMFYNFFLYAIFMLFEMFVVLGIFNLATNMMGDSCTKQLHGKHLPPTESTTRLCTTSIAYITSMANQNNPILLYYQSITKLTLVFILIATLLFFRRSQRQINDKVDESQLSPSDYTVMIKNIPLNVQTDYY